MNLVMSILVKNEFDIIEENLRFHAAQGIDKFLVMDNSSTDGTRDLLSDLQNSYDLTIVDEAGQYNQAAWMTRLARQAKLELQADLVISNDADEFWGTKGDKTLKQLLSLKESVVTAKRFNYVFTQEQYSQGLALSDCKNKVTSPILYSKEDQLRKPGLSMPLVKVSPKTIINPRGLIRLKGGNHRAKHWCFFRNRFEAEIEVHHFPIRSFTQFEKNIKNRSELLKENDQIKMGDHYRRWVKQYNQGCLEEEFSRISLSDADLQVLEKIGVVTYKDSHLAVKET